MSFERLVDPKQRSKMQKTVQDTPEKLQTPENNLHGLMGLHAQVGNQAVQRLIAQRKGDDTGGFEVEGSTAEQINQHRGGGRSLDSAMQDKMGQAMGYDFSNVKVHTSSEAQNLSSELGAKAFTTGQDVFFGEGEYAPHTSSGQELLAHELTHVVQQSSGSVGGGSGMTVNAPDDSYEKEADSVAQAVVSGGAEVQMKANESIQREAAPEEDELQLKAIQREAAPEEDELQLKAIQREAAPEEDELQLKAIQREAAPEEDELQLKAIQREAAPEEDELQLKAIQREAAPEDDELQLKRVDKPVQRKEEDCDGC